MLGFWSPRGPRVPMAWGGCVGAAGYPMGCQIGRLTRHETPLARHSQATKISKPNRFAYPFRPRPRGVGRPPILDLAPAKTSSSRDTANLGFGVTTCVTPSSDAGPVYLFLVFQVINPPFPKKGQQHTSEGGDDGDGTLD